jgi:hypothetical protein
MSGATASAFGWHERSAKSLYRQASGPVSDRRVDQVEHRQVVARFVEFLPAFFPPARVGPVHRLPPLPHPLEPAVLGQPELPEPEEHPGVGRGVDPVSMIAVRRPRYRILVGF